ncbi:hypothetical protein GCM10027044_15860 [Hymenobacter ruber]
MAWPGNTGGAAETRCGSSAERNKKVERRRFIAGTTRKEPTKYRNNKGMRVRAYEDRQETATYNLAGITP